MIVQQIPLINPAITGDETNLVKRPNLNSLNSKSQIPTKKVMTGTSSAAFVLLPIMPKEASVPPTSAAGAASTPKIHCGDDDSSANRNTGIIEP